MSSNSQFSSQEYKSHSTIIYVHVSGNSSQKLELPQACDCYIRDLTYTLPTPIGAGHQRMESTNTRCNQWLPLVKITLKVLHVGRNHSLMVNTNMCGLGSVLTANMSPTFRLCGPRLVSCTKGRFTLWTNKSSQGICKSVDWLLNSSQDHCGLHQGKNGRVTMEVEVPKWHILSPN
jgi:hypothetical protein